jgi:hypothetical protein
MRRVLEVWGRINAWQPLGPPGGIFVRLRVAKVDQQAIAQVLRHLLGESRRVDQSAEQHRQLAAFGLRRMQCGCDTILFSHATP